MHRSLISRPVIATHRKRPSGNQYKFRLLSRYPETNTNTEKQDTYDAEKTISVWTRDIHRRDNAPARVSGYPCLGRVWRG